MYLMSGVLLFISPLMVLYLHSTLLRKHRKNGDSRLNSILTYMKQNGEIYYVKKASVFILMVTLLFVLRRGRETGFLKR